MNKGPDKSQQAMDYERIRFDRASQHIIAMGERFNMISATASIIILVLVSTMSDGFFRICVFSRYLPIILFFLAILSLAFSIFICLKTIWDRLTPPREKQSRDGGKKCGFCKFFSEFFTNKSVNDNGDLFFPTSRKTEFTLDGDADPNNYFSNMEEYIKEAQRSIIKRTLWMKRAAVFIMIGFCLGAASLLTPFAIQRIPQTITFELEDRYCIFSDGAETKLRQALQTQITKYFEKRYLWDMDFEVLMPDFSNCDKDSGSIGWIYDEGTCKVTRKADGIVFFKGAYILELKKGETHVESFRLNKCK